MFQTYVQIDTPPWSVPATSEGDIVGAVKSIVPVPAPTGFPLRNFNLNTAEYPLLRISSPGLALQCLDFDGTNDSLFPANCVSSNFFGLGAKTIIVSFRSEAFPSAGNYQELLVSNNEWNFFIFNTAGTTQVYFQNHDAGGFHNAISAAITVNTNYFAIGRHDGTNVYISLNGGTEVTGDASGNTVSLAEVPQIANPSPFFNGRIGEIAFYNVALTGADLAQAIAHMQRWL